MSDNTRKIDIGDIIFFFPDFSMKDFSMKGHFFEHASRTWTFNPGRAASVPVVDSERFLVLDRKKIPSPFTGREITELKLLDLKQNMKVSFCTLYDPELDFYIFQPTESQDK
jgi:hypothetical protein